MNMKRESPGISTRTLQNWIVPWKRGGGVIYLESWSSTCLLTAPTSIWSWEGASKLFRFWWRLDGKMAEKHSLRGGMSGTEYRCLPDFFQLSAGRMDLIKNHPYHWTAEKRIQEKNQVHGNHGRGNGMLSNPGRYIVENGVALEVKPRRKSA